MDGRFVILAIMDDRKNNDAAKDGYLLIHTLRMRINRKPPRGVRGFYQRCASAPNRRTAVWNLQ